MEKAKKRPLFIAFVIAALSMSLVLMAACDGCDDDRPRDEVGTYYYTAESGGDYIVKLEENYSAALSLKDFIATGKYEYKDGAIAFDLGDEVTASVSAKYENDVLNVTYNESAMRFLRKVDYTVNFETGGGSAVESITVVNGKPVARPADPSRTDYTFLGWYGDAALTEPFDFNAMLITADTSIYAKWSDKLVGKAEYTVEFDLGYDGAPAIASMTTIGGKLYGAPVPTREGYTFRGWWASDFEDKDRLTYLVDESFEFDAATTLFAVWQGAQREGNKLYAPLPRVKGDTVTWDAVEGMSAYEVSIRGPQGITLYNGNTGSTSVDAKFSSAAALPGEYTITVRAIATNAYTDSDVTTRAYNNKALKRVSVFNVVDPSTLVYNAVDNAERYRLNILCGNPEHNHSAFDNGASTFYNFSACDMRKGTDGEQDGIRFTVTALADGYASSTSKPFYYNRTLGAVKNFYFDTDSEYLTWSAVDGAADYTVTVTSGTGDAAKTYKFLSGGKTGVTLSGYAGDLLSVKVEPTTKGYNSDANTYEYERGARLSAPTGIKLTGSVLSWDKVNGATSYTVKIGNNEIEATGVSCDITEEGIAFAMNTDYAISVKANSSDSAKSSAYSESFNAQYLNVRTVTYADGKIKWTPAIGATKYLVSVNGGENMEVEGGKTSLDIELTRAGANTVSVGFAYSVEDTEVVRQGSSISVYAYKIEFDSREGTAANPIYKAAGDTVTLPDSSRTGYDLDGWYNIPTAGAGNGQKYIDGQKLAISGDIILYAGWTPAKYTITYYIGANEKIDERTAQVVFTRNYTLDVPVRTDGNTAQVFIGWSTKPNSTYDLVTDNSGNSISPWDVNSGMTLYSVWEELFEFKLQTEGQYEDTYALTGVTQAKYDVRRIIVPETYMGKPVTIIEGRSIPYGTTIEGIEFPDTIKVIYDHAMYHSSNNDICTEVVIYETGNSRGCDYSSYDGALYRIPQNTDTGLELMFVPGGKKGNLEIAPGTKVIPLNSFEESKIESVTVPSSVVTIEDLAFANCATLKEVLFSIDDGDTLEIREGAFDKCTGLTSIMLPKRLGEFDAPAVFTGCTNLQSVTVAEGNEYYTSKGDMLLNVVGDTVVYCPIAKEGTIAIPEGVRTIGANAFKGASRFYALTLPAAVKTIGDGAFENCTSLNSVTFASGNAKADPVTVGDGAFRGCERLKRVNFTENSNVVSLGDGAFSDCTSLTSITLPKSITNIAGGLFSGCTLLTKVDVEDGHEYLMSDDGIIYDKDQTDIKYYSVNRTANTFVLPNSVQTIGNNVFAGNRALQTLVMTDHVKSIGERAFDGCANLGKVVIVPSADKEKYPTAEKLDIATYAFNNCSSFDGFYASETATEKTFPVNIGTIGQYAFYGANLGDVTLPSGMTAIDTYAFARSDITSVTIPATVKTIAGNAFYSCNKLAAVNFAADSTLESIGEKAFYYCSALTDITIPRSVKTIEDMAFYRADLTGGVTFETGRNEALTLGLGVFNSSKLTALDIPDKVNITVSGDMQDGFETSLDGMENIAELTIYNSDTETYQYDGAQGMFLVKVEKEETPSVLLLVLAKFGGDVVVPNTVSYINGGAFSDSCAASITFREGNDELPLTMDGYVFNGAGLKTPDGSARTPYPITLPARLSALSSSMFYQAGFSEVNMKACNIKEINCTWSGGSSTMWPLGEMPNLKKVVFPDKLVSIAGSPFLNDNKTTTEIILGDNLQVIGKEAFSRIVLLEKIEIPASVTTIGVSAFDDCRSLKEITFKGDNVTTIGEYAFYGCTSLKSFTLPKSVKGTSVNDKGEGDGILAGSMFSNCTSLTNFDFNGNTNIKVLGTLVFNGCPIGELVIPNTVTDISGDIGVTGSTLKTLTVPANITVEAFSRIVPSLGFNTNLIFNSDGIVLDDSNTFVKVVDVAGAKAVYSAKGDQLLYYYASNENASFTVPEAVTSIGAYAFARNKRLTTLNLPSKLATIGTYAFFGCTALTSLEIPASVTTIGEYAFRSTTELETVTFAANSGLTSIGNGAFQDSTGLESIVLPDKLAALGTNDYAALFSGCTSLVSVTLPVNLKTIPGSTFRNCTSLQNLILPENSRLESISADSFADCTSLATLDLRNAMNFTAIEGDEYSIAFDGCVSLENVYFNDNSQLSIGERAFEGTAIKSITLPTHIQSIGNNAFKDVKSLTKVIVPENCRLSVIGDSAFEGTSLTTFDFANAPRIETVGARAFYGCNLSGTVKFENALMSVGNYAFYGNTQVTELTFEGGSLATIGDYAFSRIGIDKVRIPGNNTAVGFGAFAYCADLEEVDLENGVASIGPLSFAFTAIKRIRIPSSIISLDGNPFAGCLFEGTVDQPGIVFPNNSGFYYDAENHYILDDDKTILYYAAYAEGEFSIPEGVVKVMPGAFAGSKITSVTTPASMSEIGESMFRDCPELTTVVIGKNVTVIGESAFENCAKLKTVTFEKGGTTAISIRTRAFYGCSLLETIELPHRLRDYKTQEVQSGGWLMSVNHAGIGKEAFMGCDSLTAVTAEEIAPGFNSSGYDGYTFGIGIRAFYGLKNLVSVDLSSHLSEGGGITFGREEADNMISAYAFAECAKLTTVLTPELKIDPENGEYDSTIIGKYAFYNCSSLVNFEVKEYMNNFDDYCFAGTALESFSTIDKRGKYGGKGYLEHHSFGKGVFENCVNLKSIVIHGTGFSSSSGASLMLSEVGAGLVKGCVNLETAEFYKIWGMNAGVFEGCTSLTNVTIEFDPLSQYVRDTLADGTFDGCEKLETLSITGKCTNIGEYAFRGCTSLTAFTVPAAVETIDENAFFGWTEDKTITVPFAKSEIPNGWEAGWSADATVVYAAA